jgi:hypothetical protein
VERVLLGDLAGTIEIVGANDVGAAGAIGERS